jgi:DNA ligase (NAD+)
MIHFISRKAMYVEGLGSETIDQLFREGFVKNSADLYDLTFEQVENLERMGKKSAENLFNGLNESKSVPFERVLFALGIRYVGETVAKKVAKAKKNIDAIMASTYDDLIAIDEVGEIIAISIQAHFQEEENREIVERLKQHGLKFEIVEEKLDSSILAGKSIVVSGVFNHFSRTDLKKVIEKNGGKNVSSLSSKTDYLIAGENMGPAKLEKAKKLEIQMLSEDEFLKLIEG